MSNTEACRLVTDFHAKVQAAKSGIRARTLTLADGARLMRHTSTDRIEDAISEAARRYVIGQEWACTTSREAK